jgi:hypothetical protein
MEHQASNGREREFSNAISFLLIPNCPAFIRGWHGLQDPVPCSDFWLVPEPIRHPAPGHAAGAVAAAPHWI